ncbi:putative nitrogenase cofactor biosynthesis protein NifB [Clostridia bacterium]|nr:putative nitrogenase cofactor biosynthesis protein NifB [Clostridia bacterium]
MTNCATANPLWAAKSGKRISELHPCFSIGRKNAKGRIHLPVSPGCNIRCRFCSHAINGWEDRPGVTSGIITPAEAIERVRAALRASDNLTVAGIAGPGDTLASPYALETFRRIRREFPELILCLSTNGLTLPEHVDELADIGVETLTVTVNDIDPVRLTKLCDGIVLDGVALKGVDAMEQLITNQLNGIRLAVDKGILVKVNTVLVPSINGEHIAGIARKVAEAGASLYNIIPLIPNALLSDEPIPTCVQIDAARRSAEEFITVFRHCQHCRADAIGVPGEKDIGIDLGFRRVAVTETFSHG